MLKNSKETDQLVFLLPCILRVPSRPLANKASPLAIAALVDLTVGAPGSPKPEAIAVPNLTLPGLISQKSKKYSYFLFKYSLKPL